MNDNPIFVSYKNEALTTVTCQCTVTSVVFEISLSILIIITSLLYYIRQLTVN